MREMLQLLMIGIAVLWALLPAWAGAPAPRPLSVMPQKTDFPEEMRGRLLGLGSDFLTGIGYNPAATAGLVGGGWTPGPIPRHRPEDEPPPWNSLIRFIVYDSPAAAKASFRREDTRALGLCEGSLSGKPLGDACGHVNAPLAGIIEVHFVRGNVSVTIQAYGSPEVLKKPSVHQQAIKDVETTGRVILKRIEAVIKAQGKVKMENLPPVHAVGGEPKKEGK